MYSNEGEVRAELRGGNRDGKYWRSVLVCFLHVINLFVLNIYLQRSMREIPDPAENQRYRKGIPVMRTVMSALSTTVAR